MSELDKSFLDKSNFQVGDSVEDSILGYGEVLTVNYDVVEVHILSNQTRWYAMNYGGNVKDIRRLDNLSQKERNKVSH